MSAASAWLARVRHDLVKRLVWPARDRREAGGAVRAGELVVALVDEEGRSVGALELWDALRADAPPGVSGAAALDEVGRAVARAVEAAARGDLDGVLALDAAFEELARNVKGGD